MDHDQAKASMMDDAPTPTGATTAALAVLTSSIDRLDHQVSRLFDNGALFLRPPGPDTQPRMSEVTPERSSVATEIDAQAERVCREADSIADFLDRLDT